MSTKRILRIASLQEIYSLGVIFPQLPMLFLLKNIKHLVCVSSYSNEIKQGKNVSKCISSYAFPLFLSAPLTLVCFKETKREQKRKKRERGKLNYSIHCSLYNHITLYRYQKALLCENVRKHDLFLHLIIYKYFNSWIRSSSCVSQGSKILQSFNMCNCIIHVSKNIRRMCQSLVFFCLHILNNVNVASTHVYPILGSL